MLHFKSLTRFMDYDAMYRGTVCMLLLIFIPGLMMLKGLQAQVLVRLAQPPVNRLAAKDLWNLRVQNNSKKEMKLYLEGTLDEVTEGRIVQGTSGAFILKPGETKDISPANVPGGGKYSWTNKKYQDAVVRTGSVGSGSYTICVYAKDESGKVLGQDCKQQTIQISGPPVLVSPKDGEKLGAGVRPTFTWLAPAPSSSGVKYTLKLVKLNGKQTAEEAVKRNPALFQKTGIANTMLTYPVSAPQLEKGGTYAWVITALGGDGGEVSSIPSMLSVDACGTLQASLTAVCHTTIAHAYVVTLTLSNPATDGSCDMTVNGISISPSLPYSPALSTPMTVAHNSSQTFTLLMNSATAQTVTFTITFTGPQATGTLTPSVALPSCQCCVDFEFHGGFELNNNPAVAGTIISGNIAAGPRHIQKVTAQLAYIKVTPSNDNCVQCNNAPQNFGNLLSGVLHGQAGVITRPSPPMYAPAPPFSREIVWNVGNPFGLDMSNGAPITMAFLLPQMYNLDCCSEDIRLCVRFSFEDTTCVTCDTLVCFTLTRNSTGIIMSALQHELERAYDGYGMMYRKGWLTAPSLFAAERKRMYLVYTNRTNN